MNLLWHDEALREAEELRALIAAVHPRSARSWVDELVRRIDILRTFPRAGRVIPEFEIPEFRELVIGNYRIWYFVSDDTVEILRLWDSRRETPDEIRERPGEYELHPTFAPA